VKQRFLELFSEEDYPTDYPYKSKVWPWLDITLSVWTSSHR
jgi:hypothetical protein